MCRNSYIISMHLRLFVIIIPILLSACSGGDNEPTPTTKPSDNDCIIGSSNIGDCKL